MVSRIRLLLVLLAAVTIGAVAGAPVPALAQVPAGVRVDLRVLVITDGDTNTAAIAADLATEGVPYDQVDLTNPGRPVIDAGFLADVVDGVPRAKYQAVVLPNNDPFGGGAEMTALADYERTYGIRQVDAYVWPNPAVGLNYPDYSGTLDGITAAVAPSGLAGAWGYLRGPVPFEDVDPTVAETYGYTAQPLPAAADGSVLTPLLTATPPGGTASGVLAGQYDADGRSQLVFTFAFDDAQQQFGAIAHGIVTWLTGGVHLGYDRNYFSVDVDDVLLPDSRWSVAGHCTPGEDCTGGQTTTDIRMAPDDVANAVAWEQANNFTFDLMYNAVGSVEAAEAGGGTDPLTTALLADRSQFRWTNHTYSHLWLGCVQDVTVVPWRCTTDPATGAVQYVSQADIQSEISQNVAWATANQVTLDPTELVTGEHSGMRILPQQPEDNPNLAPAVAATGVGWLGSDASRETDQRPIGPALTVPRHPLNVFYNVATVAEEVSEYNWIYTSASAGGSGLCDTNPATMTCIAPLDPGTGYSGYIVPEETRIAMSHILGNDPRPHFVHQSNFTGDRLIFPLLDSILTAYRSVFADNTPVVSQRLSANGTVLAESQAWKAAVQAGTVTAYVKDGVVTVNAPAGVAVPITVPEGTRVGTSAGDAFGVAYAGERSAYQPADGVNPITLVLPGTTG